MRWLLLLLLAPIVEADERILSFDSEIVVFADATIEVTETIRVRAEGRQIRRGIYRQLPTEYFDKQGNRYEVSIEPLSVSRNGSREDFHVRRPQGFITTYFGQSDRYIDSGEHEYRFRYRATRMLGFFKEHDELYWNVTGFAWDFPIDAASASVRFDFEVAGGDLILDAYTGPFGARGKDYSVELRDGPAVAFASNSPLSASNGLTIAVAWPKGLVDEPGAAQRFAWLLRDNRNLFYAFAGLVVMLMYYLPVWYHFGRDPKPGPIITRYEPPHGYSPASLRYIRRMGYDGKAMTAAIVSLAVKGYLDIDRSGKKHTLKRKPPGKRPEPLAAGERELLDKLFSKGDSIELDNKNHAVIGAARKAHIMSLMKDYRGKYFVGNGMMNLPPLVIAIAFSILTFSSDLEPTFFVILFIIAMWVSFIVFAVLMKQPTPRGTKLIDEMNGFADYLEIAEKDELNLRNPPEKTPELFERLLPFALALGVEQRWTEKFAAILESIRNPDGSRYQPGWYSGDYGSVSRFSSDLGSSFHSAVSSSASPPGSSSGSGGGGSSGGGGGGGGGGGW